MASCDILLRFFLYGLLAFDANSDSTKVSILNPNDQLITQLTDPAGAKPVALCSFHKAQLLTPNPCIDQDSNLPCSRLQQRPRGILFSPGERVELSAYVLGPTRDMVFDGYPIEEMLAIQHSLVGQSMKISPQTKLQSITGSGSRAPLNGEERSSFDWVMMLPESIDTSYVKPRVFAMIDLPTENGSYFTLRSCHLVRDRNNNCRTHPRVITEHIETRAPESALKDRSNAKKTTPSRPVTDIALASLCLSLDTHLLKEDTFLDISFHTPQGERHIKVYPEKCKFADKANQSSKRCIDIYIENSPDPLTCSSEHSNHHNLLLEALFSDRTKSTPEATTKVKEDGIFDTRIFRSGLNHDNDPCETYFFNLPNRQHSCGFPFNPESVPVCMPVRY